MSTNVETLTAQLELGGLAGFRAAAAQADAITDGLKRNLASVDVASSAASNALNKIKLTAAQAAETGASAEFFKAALKKISDQADVASVAVGSVKMTAGQAAESTAAGDVIDRKLKSITGNANEARRAVESVSLAGAASGVFDPSAGRFRGAGGRFVPGGGGGYDSGGGGGAGYYTGAPRFFGMPPAMLGAIGGGALLAPAAGPGALGLLAALPTMAAGGAGALGTLVLAFQGLGKAIDGDKKAYDALQPAQQKFVQDIRGLIPWVDTLKQKAANGMFPGLEKGLDSALSPGTVQAITSAVTAFAGAIGKAGEQWGRYFGSAEFQQIFGPLMAAGARNLGVMSQAALRLFDALGVLGRAAIPFTSWITTSLAAGSKWVDTWTRAKDSTGQLSGAMSEAQTSLTLVAKLAGSLVNVVAQLGAALYPVSKVAVADLTDGLNALAELIDRNQKGIQSFVSGALQALVTTVQTGAPLVEDLATAAGHVASAMGGWKTVFEALIAIKLGSAIGGWMSSLSSFIGSASGGTGVAGAESKTKGLLSNLGGLAKVGTLTLGITTLINGLQTPGIKGFLEQLLGAAGVGWALGGPAGAAFTITGVVALNLLKNPGGGDVTNPKSPDYTYTIGQYKGYGVAVKGAPGDTMVGTLLQRVDNGQKLTQAQQQILEQYIRANIGKGANSLAFAAGFREPGTNVRAKTGFQAVLDMFGLSNVFNLVSDPSGKASPVAPGKNAGTGNAGAAAGKAKLLEFAQQALGTPYLWGGNGPGGFDCSGLVQWAFANGLNVNLPRTTYDQAKMGVAVPTSKAQVGDVVFTNYGENNRKGPGHEGLIVGFDKNGQPIVESAPHTGATVHTSTLAEFTGGGRFQIRDLLANKPPTTGGGANPHGTPPPWTKHTGAAAAATLAQQIKTIRSQTTDVSGQITTDLKQGLLSPELAYQLKTQVDTINQALKSAGKDAIPAIRTNLTDLRKNLSAGLAQATDDQKTKQTIATINTDLTDGLLPKSVASKLLARAQDINQQLTDHLISPEARKKVETNLTTLKTTVSQWVDQMKDVANLKTIGTTVSQDLADNLLSPGDAKSLQTRIAAYNSELTDKLLSADVRRKVEQNITALQKQLTVDLNLQQARTSLAGDVDQMNEAIASGFYPPVLQQKAQQLAAKIGADVAQGTQAGATAAKQQLSRLAKVVQEGVDDATAIQNYQQALTSFKTSLASRLNSVLGIPETYATPQALQAAQAGAAKIIARINQGLTGPALTAAKAALQQYQNTIESALNGLEAAVEMAKTPYENAWSSIANAGDNAFQRITNQTVARMQSDLQKAIAGMQVMVQTAYGSFLYGGSITQTPAQQALAALEDQQTQAQLQQQLQAAQAAVAQATASSTVYDATTGTTTVNANNPALVQAQQQLAAAQAAIQQNQLQKQADAEQAAAQQQLQAAQDSYTDQQNAAIQAYQDQRDIQQQAMDQQVQAVETAFEQNKIDAQTAFNELTGIYKKNGIDIGGLSVAIGGVIYTGVSAWTSPIMDLMNELEAKILEVQRLLGMTPSGAGGGGWGNGGTDVITIPGGAGGSAYQQAISAIAAATGNVYTHGAIPQFDRGGPTTEGLAYLHDDEYVVPKGGALVRGGRGGGGGDMNVTLVVQTLDPSSVDWDGTIAPKVRDAFVRMAKRGARNPWDN